ncbi:aspartate--tRNA ligase [Alkalibaculum sp. M08DMB]|uniref:Aspartate--tRNA ligase n=1 Tax=Alkalibaculum sporogenes TaxID=2655001 RepID=A0A6A7K9L5_9FIRM|nr:aspartate--tRNA ligase [Alkalibaculum sporogenes]MPW26001.1 aspartate--tRNA ligase [Alkalibaculum sporogenes]
MNSLYRSHMCSELNESNIGEKVKLCGWVQKWRDLGGVIFIDLRDRSGIIQIVFDESTDSDACKIASTLRNEYVIQVEGNVIRRSVETVNDNIATGIIEVKCESVNLLDQAQNPPIYIDDADTSKESIRLKYRYLDLRKPSMQRNLIIRHKVAGFIRNYLDENGFIDVETPMLTKPTPEGARDFLVPSRVQKGNFFALPQSPQLYKQILMVSGLDRYYQIVKCFRDEDLRQDRQPEFTQIDIEMSFVDQDDIIKINEEMITKLFKKIKNVDIPLPIPRMPYKEAMERFGSDKPDIRFGLELVDIKNVFKDSGFKVFADSIASGGDIRAINAKGCGESLSRREIDALVDYVKIYKAKGLAWLKVTDTGVKSPIDKFLNDEEVSGLLLATNAEPGDLILIVADKPDIVFDALGHLRLELANKLDIKYKNEYEFLWVTDFPLFEYSDEEKRYMAKHHPFTSPNDEDIELMDTDPGSVRAKAYDLVVNGVEIGGGSIRIHNKELQEKMFEALGFTKESAWEQFGFLLEAFKYGTPPHGGVAYGLDRIMMLLLDLDNIKEVIAFPKTQNHGCLMTNAPGPAEESRLRELGLELQEE